MSKPKITVISFEEFSDDDFKKPSNYFIRSAMGDYYFFHTRDRSVSQVWCNELFGVGQYTVNASKMSKKPDSESAVGRLNTKSRMNSKGAR